MKLTENWLIKNRLILKKSDRVNKNIVYVYDVVPLMIIEGKFYFEWGNGKTHIPTVEALQTLYLALTYKTLPIDEL